MDSMYQIETRTWYGRWRRLRRHGRHRQPAPLLRLAYQLRLNPRRTRVAEVRI